MIRNSELWGGLFWLAIGGFVVWAGRDMGLGRLHEPGPGFAFYWIGILMSALALGVIGQALVSGGPTLARCGPEHAGARCWRWSPCCWSTAWASRPSALFPARWRCCWS